MADTEHMPRLSRFKVSKHFLFTAWAGSMVLFIIGVIVWCSLFLTAQLDIAFSPKETPAPPAPVRFDIKGYEKLNLGK